MQEISVGYLNRLTGTFTRHIKGTHTTGQIRSPPRVVPYLVIALQILKFVG
jgi:hypothetical protein